MRCFAIIMLLISSSVSCFAVDVLVVRHIQPEASYDNRNQYFLDMLRLALEKTKKTYGPFILQVTDKKMVQERALMSLEQGKELDVIWTMTTREREKQFLPIRIPLEKGLIGYRLFLIHKDDKEKFNSIQTLQQLIQLKAGQEEGWPDTQILRQNGLRVISVPDYDSLFRMLKKKRFDYFPRGVFEIQSESSLHEELLIEDSLTIHYPAAIYFFVNKNNKQLAKRLEVGLRMAINDGTFQSLFLNQKSMRQALQLIKQSNRRLFQLKNPLLPLETPLQENGLWHFPFSHN